MRYEEERRGIFEENMARSDDEVDHMRDTNYAEKAFENRSLTHVPVLLDEVVSLLDPRPGEFFIDGTLDGGGHARAFLAKVSPHGKFLGVDLDLSMVEKAKEELVKEDVEVIVRHANFKDLAELVAKEKMGKADGLLLDLGFSSLQMSSNRGFSFNSETRKDSTLAMTYDVGAKPVSAWLTKLREKELAEVIQEWGEERYAARIAHAIKANLPIETSQRLAEVIKNAVGRGYERGRIHPATRTFMALRIFANQELENLKEILDSLEKVVKEGGRIGIISFHSLEDRIVKHAFQKYVKEGRGVLLTKKPVQASREEAQKNPRSRSAKLRVLKLLASP